MEKWHIHADIIEPEPYLESVGNREALLLHTLDALEVPLLSSVQQEFGHDRGWRVCGATCIALGRLLSEYTGVPFRKGGLDEHLEIVIDVRKNKRLDHAYLLYFTGGHLVMMIDPIAQLLWDDRHNLEGAIEVACFSLGDCRQELAAQFDLHPFNEKWMDCNILFGDYRPYGEHDYSDQVAAINSPAALTNQVNLPSGRTKMYVSRFWGERVVRVMQATRAACPAPAYSQMDINYAVQ